MNDMLFNTLLRNVGLFITLSFACLTYIKSNPHIYIRKIILSISLIFLSISYILNTRIMRSKVEVKRSNQNISKLIFVIHVILLFYILNLLIFKKMK